MDIRVTLDLHLKSLDEEVPVFVEISPETGALIFREKGILPANRRLFRQLDQWRSSYRGLTGPYREIKLKSAQIGGSIQSQKDACSQSAERLQQQFQTWLQAASFQAIANGLREHLNREDEIRILLRTDQLALRQLPWQCWDLLNSYSKAEIVLSNPSTQRPPTDPDAHKDEHSKVRILAVLGNSDLIDTESDLQYLQTFSPEAEVEFLPQPSREALFNALWDHPWDIFFFAGHSHTEGQSGVICLNNNDPPLPITELSKELAKAIAKGLKIAIFNSCDGLGLAQDLEKLHIPHLIVMREPVPDEIAQLFLKNLLSAYSQDIPLHLAVRDAREKLAIKEREYPSASSLPILCQNPTAPSPTWSHLRTGGRIRGDGPLKEAIKKASTVGSRSKQTSTRIGIIRRIVTISLVCIVVSTLVFGLRFTSLMNASELHAYDRLMQMRPRNESADPRLLIIGIDGEDRDYQTELGMAFENSNTLSNDGLDMLIDKIDRELNPTTIGLGIYLSGSVSEKYDNLIDKFKNNPKLFTMCEVPDRVAGKDGVSPTEPASRERLGFSDFSVDDDEVIRRHLLSIRNDATLSDCTPTTNFGLLVAESYLSNFGYVAGVREDENRKDEIYFRNENNDRLVNLPRWPERSPAASQYPFGDIGGYQILLNYRATRTVEDIAEMVPMREFLENPIDPSKLDKWQQRIILIGNTGAVTSESHWTPYHRGQQRNQIGTYGVYINAHMISQIISLVLDERSLLTGLSLLKNYLWMLIWSVAGGIILLVSRRNIMLIVTDIILFGALFLISYILFWQSIWVPLMPGALAIFATQSVGLWLIAWQSKRERLKRSGEI